eukprot:5865400-Alexandrium_andersonii.AAC.1
MPSPSYKQWNRVYLRSSPTSSNGVVLLLIDSVPSRPGEWTAVDPVGRVEAIVTRNKKIFSARPAKDVDYADMDGLTGDECCKA